MREFKVGDRVKCIDDDGLGSQLVNENGTIVEISYYGSIGVCFDNNVEGHDCNNKCEDKHGWFLHKKCLKLVESSNNQKSIHISTDGTTTHAVLKDGESIIKRVKVGLYHENEYKFETGVMEVVKKLLDIEDDKNNGNFSVKCTKNDLFDTGLTVGKIYTFVDGYSKWNSGNKFPQDKINGIDRFRNIDDLNKWLNNKSYEFELVESEESKSLSDYTTDELLDEIKRRIK